MPGEWGFDLLNKINVAEIIKNQNHFEHQRCWRLFRNHHSRQTKRTGAQVHERISEIISMNFNKKN